MRHRKTSKRGRLVPLLGACGLGYLIGAWHVAALRDAGARSPAEAVALRFPHEWNTVPPVVTLAAMRIARADGALFSPVLMVPPPQSQSSPDQPVIEKSAAPAPPDRRMVQTASLDSVGLPAASVTDSSSRPVASTASKAPAVPARPRARAANRAGYILDDAQIASIKERLHLTPDQERMWPAVEAALRNMAYKRTQQVAARGAARDAQTAAVDPDAVQGLKSAAVPLIMSFSVEQKEEVRSLVHVMGLDQLASQL